MSEQDLKSWLNANKLSKILDALNENDIETLDDIKDNLETVEEINDLCGEMKLKTILRKKFIKAVVKLNNISDEKPSSQPGGNAHNVEEQKQSDSTTGTAQKLAKHVRSIQTVMQRIRQHQDKIQEYQDIMNINKDFEFKVIVNKARQIPNNGSFYTTTCLQCNYTCHRQCPYPDNSEKARCSAMDSNGYCRCCPDKCHWSMHKNLPYTVEWYQEEETKTTQALKDKYYDGKGKKVAEEQKLAECIAELTRIQQNFNE